jgi:hypothetical protein
VYKVTGLIVFFIYVVPLFIQGVYSSEHTSSVHSFMILMPVLSFWLLSSFLRFKGNAVDQRGFKVPKPIVLLVLSLLYLIFRSDLILDIIQHLAQGDYAEWALSRAIDRYNGGGGGGIKYKIGTVVYFSFAFLFGARGFRQGFILFLALFLVMSIVESSSLARAGVLLALAAYFVEFVIRYNRQLSELSLYKYLILASAACVLLSGVFLFSAYYRISDHPDVEAVLLQKAGKYTLAMYEALVLWHQLDWDYTYGYANFASVYKIFGVVVPQGFYTPVNTVFGETNIYTIIRGLVSDLSYLGAFCFFAFGGAGVKILNYKKIGSFEYFFIRLFLYILYFSLYSPFIFATVLIGFFLSFILMVLFHEKENFYSS